MGSKEDEEFNAQMERERQEEWAEEERVEKREQKFRDWLSDNLKDLEIDFLAENDDAFNIYVRDVYKKEGD